MQTKALAATALQVRSLRLALMGGQWERLGELLDYVHVAVEVNQPFVVNANHDGPIAPDLHKPVMISLDQIGSQPPLRWPIPKIVHLEMYSPIRFWQSLA
ncbi:hypothetical protein EON67_11605 [archaeon]|nr:MAG: hypothetical protein EON67_11605 [archaeon]